MAGMTADSYGLRKAQAEGARAAAAGKPRMANPYKSEESDHKKAWFDGFDSVAVKASSGFANGRLKALQAIQNKMAQAGVKVENVNWIEPHINEQKVGPFITVAQEKKTGKWSYEVLGEDGTGYTSKEAAINAAKSMEKAITKGW